MPNTSMTNDSESLSTAINLWNKQLASELWPLNMFLGFYFVFGTGGNIVVLYIYKFRLRRVTQKDKFFVLVLAAVDSLVCLTAPAFSLARNLLPVKFKIDTLCKLAWFVCKSLNAISVLLILLIGVQRYLKVCRPFGFQMTSQHMKIAVIAIFFACFVLHAPIFVFYGRTDIRNGDLIGDHCGRIYGFEKQKETIGYAYLLLVFVSAVLIMATITVFYLLIWNSLRIHIQRRQSISNGGSFNSAPLGSDSFPGNSHSRECPSSPTRPYNRSDSGGSSRGISTFRSKHSYTYMFITISAVCLVTYLPLLLVNILVDMDASSFWTNTSSFHRGGVLFAFQFFIVNHVANPFIYGHFDTTFRREVFRWLCHRRDED